MSVQTVERKPDEQTKTTSSSTARSILKDDFHYVMKNPRRRAVMRYLIENDDQEQFSVGELAEAVASWEYDTPVAQLRSKQRTRIYVGLYQRHLNVLDQFDIVEFQGSRCVRPLPLLSLFEPYLSPEFRTERDQFLTLEE